MQDRVEVSRTKVENMIIANFIVEVIWLKFFEKRLCFKLRSICLFGFYF